VAILWRRDRSGELIEHLRHVVADLGMTR
jgi:hypothetical protein